MLLLHVKILGKGLFIALFLLIFFSCSPDLRQWQHSANKGTHADYRSVRLSLEPENDFSGLEIEMLHTSQGIAIYINVFGLELRPESKNPQGYSLISVWIKRNEQSQEFKGFLLQGGHRVLLPKNASHLIIDALHAHEQMEISVAHYSSTIIPDNFVECYKKK